MEGERERRQKLLSEKERHLNHKKRETHRQREGREVVNLIESGEEMLLSQRRRPFTLCVWKLVSRGCH